MADCHLGAWADPELSKTSLEAFKRAITICMEEKVDFILFSGDLLHKSVISVDILSSAVKKLKEAMEEGIQSYAVLGSHDYSPTGKTMLKVLESAGLIRMVSRGVTEDGSLKLKFTKFGDKVKIAGLPGRRGTLEIKAYEDLDRKSLEEERGFKIFVFHSAIEEYKPEIFKNMRGIPLSLIPKGFDYYAGGHVHKRGVFEKEGYGKIVYPGPLFPTDFRELEKFKSGGFYIVTADGGETKLKWKGIEPYEVIPLKFDAQNRIPEDVESEIKESLEEINAEDSIILLRVEGVLRSGKTTEVGLNKIKRELKEKGAKSVRINTSKLSTKEYEEMKVEAENRGELESKLIEENVGQFEFESLSKEEKVELTRDLFRDLSEEQGEDETNPEYERKITENVVHTLGLKSELEAIL